MPLEPGTVDLRRAVGWALVAGLCVAAITAVAALLGGEVGETEGRTIATSVAFSLFSAIGAPGEALRRVARGRLRALGAATALAALAGFVLLLPPLWLEPVDDERLWRAWGVATVLALAGSHASLVLRARRAADGPLVAALVAASLASAAGDTALAVGAVLGVVDDPDERVVRLGAVLLVALVLTTALPPLLRRLARRAPAAVPAGLAGELRAVADRLDALDVPAGVRAEAARLRALADDLGRPSGPR